MTKPTPQSYFRRHLVLELYNAGGKAYLSDIKQVMKHYLWSEREDEDMMPVTTGEPKWWNYVCWERNKLREEGYIRPTELSERGIWELSEKGIELAKEFKDNPPLTLNDF